MEYKLVPIDIQLPVSTGRSEGIHASAIIRAIATETGILDAKWAEDISLEDVRSITDPQAVLRISIGLAWEEWYIVKVLGPLGISDHPGEFHINGVYMSPDAIDVIITKKTKSMQTIVHEIKATYKSTKTVGDLSTQWMWLAQLKSYCKAANTTHGVLHVLHLCGDYKYPIVPSMGPDKLTPQVYQIEFTQEEIDQNWDLFIRYRDEKMGLGPEPKRRKK